MYIQINVDFFCNVFFLFFKLINFFYQPDKIGCWHNNFTICYHRHCVEVCDELWCRSRCCYVSKCRDGVHGGAMKACGCRCNGEFVAVWSALLKDLAHLQWPAWMENDAWTTSISWLWCCVVVERIVKDSGVATTMVFDGVDGNVQPRRSELVGVAINCWLPVVWWLWGFQVERCCGGQHQWLTVVGCASERIWWCHNMLGFGRRRWDDMATCYWLIFFSGD